MRHKLTIVFLLSILPGSVSAQILTDSNLPIVIIWTDGGAPIPYGDPRVMGSMKIIYRGADQRNYVTDQNTAAYLNYNGRIDIERRGDLTGTEPKQQYGFSTRQADNITNNNVSLLGMPQENDWILNGMALDPSMIRDYLCFNLSRRLGEYASRTVYCELILNGEYEGLYLLTEKIKADDNRVNIIKIGVNDINLPELSGGYITKTSDNDSDPVAWTMLTLNGKQVPYAHHFPQPLAVDPLQHNYIYNQFNNLAAKALASNASISDGFPSVIDIPSFINYIIINELSSNSDAYRRSTFFHKDRNGKLRAGPVWDSDLTFYRIEWQFSKSDRDVTRFWKDLFDNLQFRCYLSKRWNDLIQPGQPLNLSVIEIFIDQTVATISEAVARDYARWEYAINHQQRISDIKYFLNARITWITNNIGPYSSCSNVAVPPLVIIKIMYHPEASIYSSDNDDLEFLEIMNNSDKTVDLTGIYFGGTGFVYQFPANSTLGPYKLVFLASNSTYFQLEYGFVPYGQFTRHLSNKSENLVLLDAFGNIIDNVNYCDSLPWPNADGNGYYLMLKDANLNNSVAGNWTISNNQILSANDICVGSDLQLSPNPVKDILKIKAQYVIKSASLYDMYGRLLETIVINDEAYDLDMKQYAKGLYILRVVTAGKTFSRKIIKD
ncbi:MAG: CotH kinase family protein [Bacteroidales bacterium]|nr:CotH kinase family protein [Bacteroidales bacterium]